ncbi:MAG: SufD family Fe-S cluster assembly protein, partial [Verrucomicrobiota bacterium]
MIQTEQLIEVREKDPHLRQFENLERTAPDRTPSWLYATRKAALARFSELGFPTTRDENWRFTNIAPIAQLPFEPVLECDRSDVTRNQLLDLAFSRLESIQLVFVNGHFAPELSYLPALPSGVQIGSIGEGLCAGASLLERHLARYARVENNPFTALNTAFFLDGAYISIPAGVALDKPIHLLFISNATDRGATISPRILIVAERHSRVTVLESYASVHDAEYFTNSVTEIVAEEGARVEHCKFQDESLEAFHMAALHLQLEKASNVISHSIATGGRLSRANIYTQLGGPGVECVLNGLYLGKDEQTLDHFMIVEHAQPHCNSHEYFNGILDGRSRGIFHGRILVQQIAQKTDAKQTNKNLLLSD